MHHSTTVKILRLFVEPNAVKFFRLQFIEFNRFFSEF